MVAGTKIREKTGGKQVREVEPAEVESRTRLFLQPIAAPSILGLYGFAGATFIVAAYLANWFGPAGAAYYLFPFDELWPAVLPLRYRNDYSANRRVCRAGFLVHRPGRDYLDGSVGCDSRFYPAHGCAGHPGCRIHRYGHRPTHRQPGVDDHCRLGVHRLGRAGLVHSQCDDARLGVWS
jgi:hypothetical protein